MLAVLVFIGGTLAVFFLVDNTGVSQNVGVPGIDTSSTPGRGIAETTEAGTPFNDSQLERAAEKARAVIKDFTELQNEFETNEYGTDAHQERYQGILENANSGDTLFGERKFDEALVTYQTALADVKQLLADVHSTFDEFMSLGAHAILERKADEAIAFFEQAGEVKPQNHEFQISLERALLLPEINLLIRESDRAVLREEWDNAAKLLVEVLALDPQTSGIAERQATITAAQITQALQDELTRAYRALSDEDYDHAESLFKSVLANYPDNSAALSGLEETSRSRTVAKIESLLSRAELEEASLDLATALTTYNAVLEINSSVQLAIEGRDRVVEIVTSTQAMKEVQRDPAALSDNDAWNDAKAVLAVAERHRGHSDSFDKLLEEYTKTVNFASAPLTVVILSDNATEITLIKTGRLGAFERHEVALRPGRYELVGSRDGWVDVRKSITVEPNMNPIHISCEQQI